MSFLKIGILIAVYLDFILDFFISLILQIYKIILFITINIITIFNSLFF